MNNLWAPWRLTYIKEHPEKAGCFLCAAVKDNRDKEHLVIHRGKECFCILNKYPYNSGHIMVVPNKHKADISDLTDSEMLEIIKLSQYMKELLSKMMKPEGFNLGINLGKAAGAGLLGHVHLHIVPRWNGDTNFMPAIADVKVIPQSLEDLYSEFKKHVNKKRNRVKRGT
jgi:ATP adenylyltransferase